MKRSNFFSSFTIFFISSKIISPFSLRFHFRKKVYCRFVGLITGNKRVNGNSINSSVDSNEEVGRVVGLLTKNRATTLDRTISPSLSFLIFIPSLFIAPLLLTLSFWLSRLKKASRPRREIDQTILKPT